MNIANKIKLNLKIILKKANSIGGVIFATLSVILSFFTWETLGVNNIYIKILIFAIIIAFSLIGSFVYICFWKRKVTILEKGNTKINVCYSDIMKIAFKKRLKENKIVLIPVNTSFDTIVDEDISDKPLVSPSTIHGKWIKEMISRGMKVEEIDEQIEKFFQLKNIKPYKQISEKDKKRGKRNCYKKGTIAIVNGNKKVKFFLLALSEFDENNNAQCLKDELIECIHKLIIFYNENGQGFEMFLPLMGTNLSRVNISHEESLNIITSVLKLYSDKIFGTINVVIYNKDKDKVTIYK